MKKALGRKNQYKWDYLPFNDKTQAQITLYKRIDNKIYQVGKNYFKLQDTVSKTTQEFMLHLSMEHEVVLRVYCKSTV